MTATAKRRLPGFSLRPLWQGGTSLVVSLPSLQRTVSHLVRWSGAIRGGSFSFSSSPRSLLKVFTANAVVA
jgi:hypothetical protein